MMCDKWLKKIKLNWPKSLHRDCMIVKKIHVLFKNHVMGIPGRGGTMVSFHQIGANTKKICAKKSLNKKFH